MKKYNSSFLVFLGLLAAVIFAFSVSNEHFFTVSNFFKAMKHLSIVAITSLGLTYVVIVNKADMSFHFVSCFGAMTMSYFIGIGSSPMFAVSIALFAAALIGLINGYLIGKFNLPDMVTSIGLGSAMYGFAYIYSGGQYIYRNFMDSGIMLIGDYQLFDLVPLPVMIMLSLFVLSWILMHKTTYGRNFFAVGGNATAAKFSGINVTLYIVLAFIVCAMFASLANIIQVASQGKGEIKAGITLLMPAWSAVFVGFSIFKRATVHGTFLGAFLISIMQNGFTMLSVPFFYMDFIVGITLIFSIIVANIDFDSLKDRLPKNNSASHKKIKEIP